jgi:hypothetical protein
MKLDKRQARKCAVIDLRPNQIKSEGAHIIKRSLAKEDGSETGIVVSIGLVCRYHFVTSNADTFPVLPTALGYNPPLRKYLCGQSRRQHR